MAEAEAENVIAPDVFRTSDGRVFQEGSELSRHNGYWWYDVGYAVAPAGAEANLPLFDPPGGEWSREQHLASKGRRLSEGLPSDDSQQVFAAMRGDSRPGYAETRIAEKLEPKQRAGRR